MAQQSLLRWATQPAAPPQHAQSPESFSVGYSLKEVSSPRQKPPVCWLSRKQPSSPEPGCLPTACCSRICLCVCSCSVHLPWESRLKLQPRRAEKRPPLCAASQLGEHAEPGRQSAAGGTSPWKQACRSSEPHSQPSAVPPPHPASSPPLGVENANLGL